MPHSAPRSRLPRRSALALLAGAGLGATLPGAFAAGVRPAAPLPPAPPGSLGKLAAEAGILFGASIGSDLPAGYAALYAGEVGIATTDTALKFDALRPDAATYRFGPADRILGFATEHGIKLRGHTLIWNENTPEWLRKSSSREIEHAFEAHLETVAGHYAGRLHSWDVVNEPFWPDHGRPGGYRDGPWFAAMGPSYVPRAFRRVHAVDNSARLCLNEAHCEIAGGWGEGIRPRLLALVDDLLDAGAPLHAVGLQGHLQPQWGYDDAAFQAFLEQLAKRGIDIYITELDVNDKAFPDDPAARDAAVAERYAAFLQHVLAVPQVKVVETWQLADSFSWYRDTPGGEARRPRPLPFDAALRPKAARDAMARVFKARGG